MEARLEKAAFEIVLGDEWQRGHIFEMMDELDRKALETGEPEGLNVQFAVDLDREGYLVTRRAEALLPGETALAKGKAEVYCRITENFPTAKWLGPLVLNRPEPGTRIAEKSIPAEELPNEVSDSEGYWPKYLREDHPYCHPEVVERRSDQDILRKIAAASFAGHSGSLSGAILGANFHASSGASPPATIGDCGHSGRESCPLPSTP